MSKLNLGDPSTEDTQVAAPREGFEACDEDRLEDALELVCDAKSDFANRGSFDDALADALETIQISPHLAIGYNRASELYLRKGQGLLATEIYETGLKAIGEDDPTEKSILQKHRCEMKPQYRDFIALLPLEITQHIFQKIYYSFLINTYAGVSTAWFLKIAHYISGMLLDGYGYLSIEPVAAGRLLDYTDILRMRYLKKDYLTELFGTLEKRRFVSNIKILTIHGCSFDDIPQKTIVGGLTKISQSLTSLVIEESGTISPLELLAICPNLTALSYSCWTSVMPTQTEIPRRDKLTKLRIYARRDTSETLQPLMSATPNLRIAIIEHGPPNMLSLAQKHWPKLQLLFLLGGSLNDYVESLNSRITKDVRELDFLADLVAEDPEYLDFYYDCSDISEVYKFISQQATRLRRLDVSLRRGDKQSEFTSVQFQVLEHLTIRMIHDETSIKRSALELLRGALKLKKLELQGVDVYPETFEILIQMPQLESLKLRLAYFPGIDVYLDHLASRGSAAPLKSIMIPDEALDRNQSTTLATRIRTLTDIMVFPNRVSDDWKDFWIIHFLNELIRSRSMVERIFIPGYAVTSTVFQSLSNLAALQHLTVLEEDDILSELLLRTYDFTELKSKSPHINIVVIENRFYWDYPSSL